MVKKLSIRYISYIKIMFCLAINYDLIEKYFLYFHFNI